MHILHTFMCLEQLKIIAIIVSREMWLFYLLVKVWLGRICDSHSR